MKYRGDTRPSVNPPNEEWKFMIFVIKFRYFKAKNILTSTFFVAYGYIYVLTKKKYSIRINRDLFTLKTPNYIL